MLLQIKTQSHFVKWECFPPQHTFNLVFIYEKISFILNNNYSVERNEGQGICIPEQGNVKVQGIPKKRCIFPQLFKDLNLLSTLTSW
jgi:hypothetical protein